MTLQPDHSAKANEDSGGSIWNNVGTCIRNGDSGGSSWKNVGACIFHTQLLY